MTTPSTQTITAAYQGEPGAWSEQAALDLFGPNCQPQPRVTFDEVFADVAASHCDVGVVPVENSLAGSIHRNYDLLVRHNLHLVGEVIVRVRWCLITQPNVDLSAIKTVQSHWQALGQCERTLSALLPNAQRKEVYDTAGSVKLLKESGETDVAALASRRAAHIYGLPVLQEGLEDDPTNYTRFVVLSRDPQVPLDSTKTYKTSIVFAGNNEPGLLFKAMGAFSLRNIDLCKIESRPLQGSPWSYLFYLDFVGHRDELHCQRALDNLQEFVTYLRVFGSYARAEMPK
jgi:prephenate dehydratase